MKKQRNMLAKDCRSSRSSAPAGWTAGGTDPGARTFPLLLSPSCTTHRHRTTFVPGHLAYILFVTGSFKAKRRESSTHIASHPRARRRLRVGEAVRTKSGCRMSFLTKNRRTSPQDAPEATQDKFPAAQLGLLGMVFPCHRH